MKRLSYMVIALFLSLVIFGSCYALRLSTPPKLNLPLTTDDITALNNYLEDIFTLTSGRIDGLLKLKIGGTTNYIDIENDGDFVFIGESGLCFAEIYVKDNAVATTLNSAAKVQVTIFNTNGASNNMTPDYTNDHITVTKAGMYLCTISCALVNVAAQAHIVELLLYKNNGTTAFNNIHAHRNLSGGGGDKGSISLSGIIDLAVNDTIELWANTDAAANRDVIFEDVTFSLVQIGG